MKRASNNSNYKNIKDFRVLFLCLVVLILSGTSAFALDPLGPPAAEIRKGQVKVGIEYSLSSMNLELTNGTGVEKIYDFATETVDTQSGGYADVTIEDFDLEKVNVYFGYGLERNWEAFVRVGASSSELDSFDSDYTPSIGGGLRFTMVDDRKFKLGCTAQIGWTKYGGEVSSSEWFSPGYVDIDIKEVQATLGALYKWTNYFSIYGGPFYHFIFGEYNFSLTGIANGIAYSKYSADIETNSNFGGYLGARIDIDKNTFLNCEYHMTADADCLSAGLIFQF